MLDVGCWMLDVGCWKTTVSRLNLTLELKLFMLDAGNNNEFHTVTSSLSARLTTG